MLSNASFSTSRWQLSNCGFFIVIWVPSSVFTRDKIETLNLICVFFTTRHQTSASLKSTNLQIYIGFMSAH